MKHYTTLVAFAVTLGLGTSVGAVPLPWWVCVKTTTNTANEGQPPNYKTAVIGEPFAEESAANSRAQEVSTSGIVWQDVRNRRHYTAPALLDDVYVEAFNYETGQVCKEPIPGSGGGSTEQP